MDTKKGSTKPLPPTPRPICAWARSLREDKAEMAIDLTGIQNVGEFYSHHYLDALLENDLRGLFAKWRENENESAKETPDRRLNACATAYFTAKSRALKESKLAARYAIS